MVHTKDFAFTDKQVEDFLNSDIVYRMQYQSLDEKWQCHFRDFLKGHRTLPLTYDPFFKTIFHPNIHGDRLSNLLSSLLGIPLRVSSVLSRESSFISKDSLIIMDIVVQLEDGSLANVEIQKIGYKFLGSRLSCYSSDLVLRQYTHVHENASSKKNFTYNDIKKVYVIVIYESSPSVLSNMGDTYIHYGKTTFDTGLDLDLLQEYCLISLDVYRKSFYDKMIEEDISSTLYMRHAWLRLLCASTIAELEDLIKLYPFFEDILEEIAEYMTKPEEVLQMFSSALEILDRNTVRYMVDEMQATIDEQKSSLAEKDSVLAEQRSVIAERDSALAEQRSVIAEKDSALAERDSALAEKDSALAEKDALIRQLQEQLSRR